MVYILDKDWDSFCCNELTEIQLLESLSNSNQCSDTEKQFIIQAYKGKLGKVRAVYSILLHLSIRLIFDINDLLVRDSFVGIQS